MTEEFNNMQNEESAQQNENGREGYRKPDYQGYRPVGRQMRPRINQRRPYNANRSYDNNSGGFRPEGFEPVCSMMEDSSAATVRVTTTIRRAAISHDRAISSATATDNSATPAIVRVTITIRRRAISRDRRVINRVTTTVTVPATMIITAKRVHRSIRETISRIATISVRVAISPGAVISNVADTTVRAAIISRDRVTVRARRIMILMQNTILRSA